MSHIVKGVINRAVQSRIDRCSVEVFIDSEDIRPGENVVFGGLYIPGDLLVKFINELRDVFQVSGLRQLTGCKCICYRSFPTTVFYNERFEGIESVDTGKRMTLTGFRQRHCGLSKSHGILADRMSDLSEGIRNHRKKLEELINLRADLSNHYQSIPEIWDPKSNKPTKKR